MNATATLAISLASLGIGDGPTADIDVNQPTNETDVMSIRGSFWPTNSYLSSPSTQFFAVGADTVTGLARIPSPATLALAEPDALGASRRPRA